MGYRKPKILVNNIPLMAPLFSWSFQPGANPHRQFWVVPNEIAAQLKRLANPVTVTAEIHGAIGGRETVERLTLKNMWIIQFRRVDAAHEAMEIADVRSRWRGRRWTNTANRTWRANDFGSINPEFDFGDSDDPASLRAIYDRFQRFRYLPWSVNFDSSPKTALQLLIECLQDLGHSPVVTAPENNVVFENRFTEEETVQSVLTELANQARADIAVDADGSIRVYPIDETPPSWAFPNTEAVGAGVLYRQDLRRFRPAAANVRFRARREVAVLNTDEYPDVVPYASATSPIIGPIRDGITQEDYLTGKAVACYNVVQLPLDYTSEVGVIYKRGTWIPMAEFLALINLSEDEIRALWWEDLLEMQHAVIAADQQRGLSDPDPRKMMEVQAIRKHWRQSWQMDPYWVTRWESWDTKRAALVDPITRTAAPAPLWTYFTHVPTVFPAAAARHIGLWKKRAVVYRQNPEANQQATHGTVQPEDPQLGVFRVEFPPDPDATITTVLPFGLTEESIPEYSPAAAQFLWLGARIEPDHRVTTVVSTTPAVNANDVPDDDRYFSVVLGTEGEGPEVEWLEPIEYARFAHPIGLEEDDPVLPLARIDAPVNLPILVAAAQSRATVALNTYIDRIAGNAVFPGIGNTRLFSNCRGITVTLNKSGLRTSYDMTQPPVDPLLVNNLTAEQRQYLYQQLPTE